MASRTTQTERKSPARRKSKAAPKAAQADSAPAQPPEAEIAAVEAASLRKAELIERAIGRCNVKKRDAKPAIEAALAVLGEALAAGEELILPPLGRVRITRRIEKENAEILIARIRRSKTMQKNAENAE